LFFFIFDDLCAFAMLLLMFVPSLVENGCKTKSVLQIENSGSTTTLSKIDSPQQLSVHEIEEQLYSDLFYTKRNHLKRS